MRVTINDVAKLASVHPGTVSRVLNARGAASRISEATQQRVLQAAQTLGFYPDHAAQSLARSATNIIGVYLYPNGPAGGGIGDYQARIIDGIGTQSHACGYDLILMGLSVPEDDVEQCKRQLYQRRIDGLIIVGNTERSDAIKALAASGKPVIGIDSYADDDIGTLSINIDNFQAAVAATEYLMSLGHRKIGFIGSPYEPEGREESLRRKGYRHALESNGICPDSNYVINSGNGLSDVKIDHEWCRLSGRVGVNTLLEYDCDITAVFCMNDQVAAGAIHSLHEMGIRVPEQFSVIGFDDSPIAPHTYPPLTTVRHHLEEMGRQAVVGLVEVLTRQKAQKSEIRYVDAELVVRESTAALKEGDMGG